MMMEIKHNAATLIQKYWRGYSTRKLFKIQCLLSNQLEHYATFVVGNDPIIENLELFQSREAFLLVGTSGIRSIALASELNRSSVLPKIILIDTSKQVHAFWRALKLLVEKCPQQSLFLINLSHWLTTVSDLYRDLSSEEFSQHMADDVRYLNPDIKLFFTNLIDNYGYHQVRQLILTTTCIPQSWAHQDTFIKIKNIMQYLKINISYVYVSNILFNPSLNLNELEVVMRNIALLKPKLTIHSNLCLRHGMAEKIFLQEDSSVVATCHTLFGGRSVKAIKPVSSLMPSLLLWWSLYFYIEVQGLEMSEPDLMPLRAIILFKLAQMFYQSLQRLYLRDETPSLAPRLQFFDGIKMVAVRNPLVLELIEDPKKGCVNR